jgi:predicted TIM-barrel fold metal-dependent hydrolase
VSLQTIEAVMPSAPSRALPAGACDCHGHVFGPLERFPTGASTYAIPLAAPRTHGDMLKRCGLSRAVLVQPAPYGIDTGALEAALAMGAGRLRGIAVAHASIADAALACLHAAGVRGLRFVEMKDPVSGQRYAGSVALAELEALAPRMRALGWQAQIWAPCGDVPALVARYGDFGVPLVFDHMGQFDASRGVEHPAFQAFLRTIEQGRAWTKLTLCRLVPAGGDLRILRPFHEALTQARPDRLLWGSDWPFVRMGARSPDVGQLLDLFLEWVDDDALARRILVENPAGLFEFERGA